MSTATTATELMASSGLPHLDSPTLRPLGPRFSRARRWLALLVAALCVGGGAIYLTRPGGRAMRAELQFLLPTTGLYAPQTLRRDFFELQYNPKAEPQFAFHLLAPKTWEEQRLDPLSLRRGPEDREPVLLSALSPRDHGEGRIEISYLHLQKPSGLRQLMDAHARRLGARILARQPGTFNDREVEDALLRWHHPQLGSLLTRVTISRQGDFLFLVSCSTRESRYAELRGLFGVAAISFAPLRSPQPTRTPQT